MTQHVDWAEVERRGRRREWLGLPLLFAWLAEPPGPERDVATLRGWERWLTGRRAALALLALLLVPMALVAVIVALR